MASLVRGCCAVFLSFAAVTASASPASPQDGVDYSTISASRSTQTRSGKVEVIEFFGYFCSHCHVFDEALSDWAKKQGRQVRFRRIPVNFGGQTILHQRMYFTLVSMGKMTDTLHKRVFRAAQVERLPLRSESQIADFLEKNGINRGEFVASFRSRNVQALMDSAAMAQTAYGIDGVPVFVVDGKYLTSPAQVNSGNKLDDLPETEVQRLTLQVVDNLVSRVSASRKKISGKAGR
ncbi:MAG: thiol:disulfide interchange protein DsbA/DsbL [Burkholderiaceae bacterium]|jgi:thiol:disulfide interchange protein DsbA|nr:thiol:disulfide interchange protein DsbA/DsbL [Burkholderiaceae bacterium]